MLIIYILILCRSLAVVAYSNKYFTVKKQISDHRKADVCGQKKANLKLSDFFITHNGNSDQATSPWNTNFLIDQTLVQEDPFVKFHNVLCNFMFGDDYYNVPLDNNNTIPNEFQTANLLHYPTGRVLRNAELFNGKKGVHVPIEELMHQGSAMLNLTQDYMQTAVDAFTIFVKGDLDDIKRLPAEYVLDSARTISMMMISHEKLAATWSVVKGKKETVKVTYETLEKYRPLFKYLGGKEMAKLNLSDPRILNYVGTHPDLNRHQVGMVASKYMKLNSRWMEPRFLNSMNNLLCGVPITYMRELPENTYLQLSHQVFYHTRACDPLQRRFYLGMMTRTQRAMKTIFKSEEDTLRALIKIVKSTYRIWTRAEEISLFKTKSSTLIKLKIKLR